MKKWIEWRDNFLLPLAMSSNHSSCSHLFVIIGIIIVATTAIATEPRIIHLKEWTLNRIIFFVNVRCFGKNHRKYAIHITLTETSITITTISKMQSHFEYLIKTSQQESCYMSIFSFFDSHTTCSNKHPQHSQINHWIVIRFKLGVEFVCENSGDEHEEKTEIESREDYSLRRKIKDHKEKGDELLLRVSNRPSQHDLPIEWILSRSQVKNLRLNYDQLFNCHFRI